MTDIIPREFIELLLAKIDLVDLINVQVPLRKKSGSNYFARCPFHNEKSASFSVSQPKQFYYCFGCGAHGNAIDFMMQHERLSFPEAIEALARHTGMEVPRSATFKKDDSLPALYELMKEAAAYYYDQMRQSKRAIQYLKQRGISGAIARQFSLGYALPGWSHVLDTFGKTEADKKRLLETGLVIKKNEGGYYDRFRDRIMFPIHDYRGRVIGFGGRILDQGEPKYLNSPETPLFQKGHELYGLYQALKANRKLERVMVVEGYMDVIALFQHGLPYAVATLGTATSTHHLERLFRYTAEIIFCFDGDEAGRGAAWRALQVIFPLMHDNLQVRFLFLPEGEDPDSLVRKEGKTAFEKRLQDAPSLSAFFFQTLSRQSDMSTMEGRARLAAQALDYIKQLPSGIFQEMMTEELSKQARIDIYSLKQQIKDTHRTASVPTINAETPAHPLQPAQAKTKMPVPVKLAIALLVQYPRLASLVQTPLPTAQLPGYSFLSRLLEIVQNRPNIVTTGALIEYWRGQKEETFIMKMAHFEHMIPDNGIESEFLGTMRQIAMLAFDEEINRLLAKATREGLSEEEKVELSAWIAKKKTILSI
ncbi:DNA primase [Aquicella lusitana]|uniref:DNA primase n=1 Tax=Aquicella lusitana TaxID=254246 RepID=A0A370GE92_9COXI|nr:DNA primase [Aquicella lusitana]RDI41526.1 DNA primase [Aquicella lusitana]VVC72580.1 DNA primase [Aquicella lusitana]